jgi:hypothetical protein
MQPYSRRKTEDNWTNAKCLGSIKRQEVLVKYAQLPRNKDKYSE